LNGIDNLRLARMVTIFRPDRRPLSSPVANTAAAHRALGGHGALSPDHEPVSTIEVLNFQIDSDACSPQYRRLSPLPGGAMIRTAPLHANLSAKCNPNGN
jgi:hypothetical protein